MAGVHCRVTFPSTQACQQLPSCKSVRTSPSRESGMDTLETLSPLGTDHTSCRTDRLPSARPAIGPIDPAILENTIAPQKASSQEMENIPTILEETSTAISS